MALFEWKPFFAVTIEMVDQQHKQLIALMNTYYEKHLASDYPAAIKGLKELVDYTVKHFKDEENLMQKTGYPDFKSHQEGHQSLLKIVTRLSEDYAKAPGPQTGEKLGSFLKNWLAGHILGIDKKYAPHLHSKGVH